MLPTVFKRKIVYCCNTSFH